MKPGIRDGEREGAGNMPRVRDLTGEKFGRLTVLEKTKERQNGYVVWRCRCDCGNEAFADTKRLLRGSVTDCGCIPKKDARRGKTAEDLTGCVFGELTVVERTENRGGRTCWRCRCSCGAETEATAHDLKAGKVKSCGGKPHRVGRNRVDLRDKKFGRLTALYPTERRDRKGSVYWHCACDCGRMAEITEWALVSGSRRSCGCLKSENQKKIFQRLHMVDGTCIEMLEKRKNRRDNVSGFRGVCQMKNQKYRVSIGFKGKRYYLGIYENFSDAVQARLDAEELIHTGFINTYRAWEKRAKEDPQWAEKHPLVFDVKKENGCLKILE